MDVVSTDVNNVLPDEIMETGISLVDDDSIEAITISSPLVDEAPMETELEGVIEVSSSGECVSTSLVKEVIESTSNHAGKMAMVSVASKPDSVPSASAIKTVLQAGLHKQNATVSGQVILNKVSQASDLTAKSHVLKQEGQKLIVTTLGKASHPIVLTLPQTPATHVQHVESKVTPQHIKLVSFGGNRPDGNPVLGMSTLTSAQIISPSTKSPLLQTQQIKTVQIGKKTPASSSGPVITKLIIAKPLNSKALTGQTAQVSSSFAGGRALSNTNPVTPPKVTSIADIGVIGTSSTKTTNKIAISPLKSPS